MASSRGRAQKAAGARERWGPGADPRGGRSRAPDGRGEGGRPEWAPAPRAGAAALGVSLQRLVNHPATSTSKYQILHQVLTTAGVFSPPPPGHPGWSGGPHRWASASHPSPLGHHGFQGADGALTAASQGGRGGGPPVPPLPPPQVPLTTRQETVCAPRARGCEKVTCGEGAGARCSSFQATGCGRGRGRKARGWGLVGRLHCRPPRTPQLDITRGMAPAPPPAPSHEWGPG